MNKIKLPKLLRIRGVFLKDCTKKNYCNDVMIERLQNQDSYLMTNKNPIVSDEKYIPLPDEFITLSCWLKETNLHCWYCTLQFNTIPIFIPKNINKKMQVYGVFCSFTCGYNFIHNQNETISKKTENKLRLKHLFSILYPDKVFEEYIYTLNDYYPYMLKKYGGHLTIGEFKEITHDFL